MCLVIRLSIIVDPCDSVDELDVSYKLRYTVVFVLSHGGASETIIYKVFVSLCCEFTVSLHKPQAQNQHSPV